MINDYTTSSGLPPQKLPLSKKNEVWRKECVDAIIALSNFSGGAIPSISPTTGYGGYYRNKLENYNIIANHFTKEQFQSIFSPSGIDLSEFKNLPSPKLTPVNSIVDKQKVLCGEELNRPFKFKVVGISDDIVKEKINAKNNSLKEEFVKFVKNSILQSKIQQAREQGLDPEQAGIEGQEEAVDFEGVAKNYENFQHSKEKQANERLNYLYNSLGLQSKFNKGFEHAFVCAEEIYKLSVVDGNPEIRVVNPLDFSYELSSNTNNIGDSSWCVEVRNLSAADILDEYGEYLSASDVEKIDRGLLGYTTFGNLSANSPIALSDYEVNDTRRKNYRSGIVVAHVCWKSMKQIGFCSYIDIETGMKVDSIIEEKSEIPEQYRKIAEIEWRWVNEVWEGVRIGDDIYCNIEPAKVQFRNSNNLSYCSLPYVGGVYDNIDGRPISYVDRLKPLQFLKIVLFTKLETELAKAKGKKLVIDAGLMGKNQDIDEKILQMDALDILIVGEESRGATQVNNQVTTIDLTASNNVTLIIQVIDKIDMEIERISGINSQRRGMQMADTTSTNKFAVSQSFANTEVFFFFHNEVKRDVLEKLLQLAKICYQNREVINQVVENDIDIRMIKTNKDVFSDSEYGIFVSNSGKDTEMLKSIMSLASTALQQEKINLSDFMAILRSDSIAEVSKYIRDGEEERAKLVQQNSEQQMQIQQQKNEIVKQQNEIQLRENELDRNNRIEVAKINASKGMYQPETDNSDDIYQKEQDRRLKQNIEQSKLIAKEKEKQTDAALQIAELKVKLKDSENKVKIATQNKNKYDN